MLRDVDLTEEMLREIVAGCYSVSGQVCFNIKRIYVHRSRYEEFLRGFLAMVDQLVVGPGDVPEVQLGPLTTAGGYRNALLLLDDARSSGATIHEGGRSAEEADLDNGQYLRPTVVTRIARDAEIVVEEQFAPIIPVLPFETDQETIAEANRSHRAARSRTRRPPIFEAAESLDTPIYLRPNTPSPQMIQPYLEAGLDGAVFGFAGETGLHLLRIITPGVFDRFPNLKIVVGHLGEPLELCPSQYLTRNVWYTTSGMPWAPAVEFVRNVVGKDRVMFAWDYPYQWNPAGVADMDAMPWSTQDKKEFFQGTAESVFGL